MNIHIVTIFITIALAFGLAADALADDHADIVALYKKLETAQRQRSPEGTLALLAPGFSYTNRAGKVLNREAFVKQMEQQLSGVKAIREMKMKVIKVEITGKSAKVTNSFSWAMEIEDKRGEHGPAGMTHVLASTGSVDNSLAKTDEGWRFLTLHTVGGNMTMDGKPVVQPNAAQPTAASHKK